MRRVVEATRRAPITALLLLACVAVFVVMCARGSFEPGGPEFDEATLLRFGALRPDKVWEGEWWRLLSAGLVHGDPLHILFNAWALVALGPPLERLLSAPRTLLVVLGSQLGCTVAHVCFGGMAPLVGASGVACGMLGALLVALIRRRDPPAAAGRRTLVFWAVQVLIFSIAIPGVSLLAHFGGGAAGAALMVGLEPSKEHRFDRAISLAFACLLLGIGVRLALYEPERGIWNVVQAFSRYDQRRFAEAIPFFREALQRGSGDFRAEVVEAALGDSLLETHDRDAGLAELGLADADGNAYAAHRLAEVATDPHVALSNLARAIELEPQEPEHRQALLRQVVELASQGDLPSAPDLAPLIHLPDGAEYDGVRLVQGVATAESGDLAALVVLAKASPPAARLLAAYEVDGGEDALPGLLHSLLLETPGLFQQGDGGPATSAAPHLEEN